MIITRPAMVVVAACALGGAARARQPAGPRRDAAATADARRQVEQLVAEANRTGALARFDDCGRAYLAIYDQVAGGDPAQRGDELLYNAGVCFEQGRSIGAALDAYRRLVDRYPRSPLLAHALARMGAAYARIADHAHAAERLELYARRFPGEHDAPDALRDAITYRVALGDDAAAIADTLAFIKLYGARRAADSAAAFFALGPLYERHPALGDPIAHYRAYLGRYRVAGGGDRAVAAAARLGQLLWERSCPVPLVDGSCAREVRLAPVSTGGPNARARCGPAIATRLVMVARDPAVVKQARAVLDDAVSGYERAGGGFPGGDGPYARWADAQARWLLAELDYEQVLASTPPRDLDFDPARHDLIRASAAKLGAWFDQVMDLATRTRAEYEGVVTARDAMSTVAATARIGQIARHLHQILVTSEVPRSLRRRAATADGYCAAFDRAAAPLVTTAQAAFERCLAASSEIGIWSEWSARCERELGVLAPDQVPPLRERSSAPRVRMAPSDLEAAGHPGE